MEHEILQRGRKRKHLGDVQAPSTLLTRALMHSNISKEEDKKRAVELTHNEPADVDIEDENSFLITSVLFISVAFVLVLYARKIYSQYTASNVFKPVKDKVENSEKSHNYMSMSSVLTWVLWCLVVVAIISRISAGVQKKKRNFSVNQSQQKRIDAAVNVFTVSSSATIPDAITISVHGVPHDQWATVAMELKNTIQPITSPSLNSGAVSNDALIQYVDNEDTVEKSTSYPPYYNVQHIGPFTFSPSRLALLLSKLESLRLTYSLKFSLSREAIERERSTGVALAQLKAERLAPPGFTIHTSTSKQYYVVEHITYYSEQLCVKQTPHPNTFSACNKNTQPSIYDQISDMMDPCGGQKIVMKTEFESTYVP